MVLLRREIGDVLRHRRTHQGRTLREVSAAARVSLGYLSEVERGQKEPSSELLSSICGALDVPLSSLLLEVSSRVADAERGLVTVPDTVPADLAESLPAGLTEGLPDRRPGGRHEGGPGGEGACGGCDRELRDGEGRGDLLTVPAA